MQLGEVERLMAGGVVGIGRVSWTEERVEVRKFKGR